MAVHMKDGVSYFKMYIKRCAKNSDNPFTQVSNKLITSNLSLTSKGLLIEILQNKDDYRFHPTVFWEKYGRRSIDNSIRELIEAGYCHKIDRGFLKSGSKVIRNVEFYFFESPELNTFSMVQNVPLANPDNMDKSSMVQNVPLTDIIPGTSSMVQNEQSSMVQNVPLIISNTISISKSNSIGNAEIETDDYNLPIDLDFVNFEQDGFSNHPKEEKESKSGLMVKSENKSETNQENMKIKKEFTLKRKDLIHNAIKIACESFQIKFEDKVFDKWYNWKVGLDGEGKVLLFEALLNSFKTFSAKDRGETPEDDRKSNRAVQIEEKERLRLWAADRKKKEDFKEYIKVDLYKQQIARWEGSGIDQAATKLLQRIQFGLDQFDKYPFEVWKKCASKLRDNIFIETIEENLKRLAS